MRIQNPKRIAFALAALAIVQILLLASPAHSEKIIEIALEINETDTASVIYKTAYEGRLVSNSYEGGDRDYAIEILDSSKKAIYSQTASLTFVILTDPPQKTESLPIVIRTNYSTRMDSLRIRAPDGSVIYEGALALCNSDSVCSGFENSITCPADCQKGGFDGYCEAAAPGCDSDCYRESDSDCLKAPSQPEGASGSSGGAAISAKPETVVLLVLVSLGALFYFLFLRKGKSL